ncbi:hypothetical protein HYN59_08090 [Flavobacterium album]|uniref:Uncharacterized protein n=1 Tax=Flavobacterium album TaxID=2175091 RepID=A0A2S1QXE2_9FLAO|nr:hypothetical protein [Flavobacterium album]AWH85087.1 hypothetical protein HYN59_08090 [Flavobacterium album]
MNKEKFIFTIKSGQTCYYIYGENEQSEMSGIIKVWLNNNEIALTWEECPKGLQYDESSYSKDEVYNFSSFDALDNFFYGNNIPYDNFKS